MNDQGLGDDIFHAKARVERGERILKNNLQVAAQAAHFAPAGGEQIASFEADRARSGLDQAKDEASQRALARAGFADEAERLSGMNVERNIIDCADFSARLAAKRRLAVREDLRQVADFKQRHSCDASSTELLSREY